MKAVFTLCVHGHDHCQVSPIKRDESPHLKFLMDALDQSLYIDEDLASAAVEIKSIEQLQIALEYYAGKSVQLQLTAEVTDGNHETMAILSHKPNATSRVNMREKISIEQATKQIIAICQSITNKQQ